MSCTYVCVLTRHDILQLSEASLRASRPDYARKLSRSWLQAWPHDFSVNILLAKALSAETDYAEALVILNSLAIVDPESAELHQVIATVSEQVGDTELHEHSDVLCRVLLGGSLPRMPWAVAARECISAIEGNQWEPAARAAERAVQANQNVLLSGLLLLKSYWLAGESDLTFPLAQGFFDRWPQCVALTLCLAEALLRHGDYNRGVELLHNVVSLDPAGEVSGRYWGDDHSYRPIWPPEPQIGEVGPIPPEVAMELGLNRLGEGTDSDMSAHLNQVPANGVSGAKKDIPLEMAVRPPLSQVSDSVETSDLLPTGNERSDLDQKVSSTTQIASQLNPESIHGVEQELQRLQRELDAVTPNKHVNGGIRSYLRGDGIHVILTSVRGLVEKYGTQTAEKVLTLIRLLAENTAKHTGMECSVVLPDVADNLAPFQLGAVDGRDPHAIKGLINELSGHFQGQGKRIGSILLIGGDDILPFYRLPNPTDDHDDDVPSDNPYGSSDDNYFVPEWPVGRLPAPCGNDAGALIGLIQNTIRAHERPKPTLNLLVHWLRWFFPLWQPKASGQQNFGYSADIWRDASLEVFNVIGKTRDLVTSPPLEAANMPNAMLDRAADFLYCNLHGLEDAAEWYGESASLSGEMPNYPVALRTTDISHGAAPSVVFTEACYGANIVDKHSPEEAMCLRFLQAGSRAVVGSTRIAYGAVGVPLIGADLLGRFFWHYMRRGIPVGESLRRSRMGLAQMMDSRQGFLDGEDQKALISFVLYGDPLLRGPKLLPPLQKSIPKVNPISVTDLRATCAKGEKACATALGQPEALAQVKALVSQYLPGMENGNVNVRRPQLPSHCDCGCSSSNSDGQKTMSLEPDHLVYSLSRKVRVDTHEKHQYAHATVNQAGKVVKLAVSR